MTYQGAFPRFESGDRVPVDAGANKGQGEWEGIQDMDDPTR